MSEVETVLGVGVVAESVKETASKPYFVDARGSSGGSTVAVAVHLELIKWMDDGKAKREKIRIRAFSTHTRNSKTHRKRYIESWLTPQAYIKEEQQQRPRGVWSRW